MDVQRLGTLLIVAVLLAGCAKGGAKSEEPTSTNAVQVSGESLPDAGSIEGIVVDESVAPIQGAVVSLEGLEGQAVTDEAGAFFFNNLAPGSYNLFVAKLGFEASAKKVDVVANQPTKVTASLVTIAIKESYVESIEFKLFMTCGGGLVIVTFTGGCPSALLGDHSVVADHNVTGDAVELRSLVAELIWQQTSGFSSKELRMDVGINETSGSLPQFGEEYGSETGLSPVVVRAEADEDESFDGLDGVPPEDYYIRHRVWVPFSSEEAPIVILVLQQPMTIWSTFFYGEEGPADYSALPDA